MPDVDRRVGVEIDLKNSITETMEDKEKNRTYPVKKRKDYKRPEKLRRQKKQMDKWKLIQQKYQRKS